MNEMYKLAELLDDADIPYEIVEHWSGTPQVCYPSAGDNCICDAVCFYGSYGYQKGLLEIMGLVDVEEVGESVEGWLTAEEVFQRIRKHYQEEN